MCVLIFYTNFAWNISHFKKNWERYDQKCLSVLMWSTGYSCQILTEIEFSRQIFEKYSDLKFLENPFNGSRFVPCGRKDKQTWRMLYSFFGAIPRNMNFMCRRFGSLCSIFIGDVGRKFEIKRQDEVTRQKKQSVNAVYGNNRCLFSDPHKTHKYSCVGRT